MSMQRLLKVRQAREEAKIKSAEARGRKEKKRAEKGLVPKVPRLTARQGRRMAGVFNSQDVREWFSQCAEFKYGRSVVIGDWSLAQCKLANMMIEVYGHELTKKSVEWFFENWDALSHGKKGNGSMPTISMLWTMRADVFMSVQAGKSKLRSNDPKMHGEYEDCDGPSLGWK